MAPRKGAAVEVSIVDRGLDALFARVRAVAPQADAQVGVIEPKDPETALIARVHEMGLGKAPQRSFLRRTLEAGKRRYAALSKLAFGKFLDGDWSLEQALISIGIEIKSDVQKSIIRGIAPPLQDETVDSKRRRGLPRPRTALYATGKLYESIKLRVVGTKPGAR